VQGLGFLKGQRVEQSEVTMVSVLKMQALTVSGRDWLKHMRLYVLAISVFLLLLGFRIALRVEGYILGYRLADARQVTVELDMERRDLELQLSVLSRPDRLRRLAHDRLGLQDAQPHQVYYLR
jgi:cell division protein FtsL